MSWPVTCAECIELAECYRRSGQWLDAAVEYRKAIARAKDEVAADELRHEEFDMLRCAFRDRPRETKTPDVVKTSGQHDSAA